MLSSVTRLPKSMAIPDQHQLHVINHIVERLSSNECRSLLYLCESVDMDDDMTRVKEILKRKVMYDESGQLFLAELMLHLRRFDILRNVLKTSREQVERDFQYRERLPRFKVLMVNISEDMTKEDLSSLKFLFGRILPRERMDKAKSFVDVTIELEKLDLVSPENVDLVELNLRNINRNDLAKKVSNYKMSVSSPEQLSSASCLPSTLNYCHPLQQRRQIQSHPVESIAPPVHVQQNCQNPHELYKFNTNPRGVCIIIDCVGNDGDMLEHTFKALQFNVVLYKWLSVEDTFSVLRGIFTKRENCNGDGFVCCIISRGLTNRLLCTDPDSPGLHLDSVRCLFTADACPMLAGKPKLFFIQTYSVPGCQPYHRVHHRDEDLETDGWDRRQTYRCIPTDADVFWSHCWTDDHLLEQKQHQSVYLKALADALQKGQRRKTKLVDIHTEVNGVVFEHNRNPQEVYHIELKHTLRKDLYF